MKFKSEDFALLADRIGQCEKIEYVRLDAGIHNFLIPVESEFDDISLAKLSRTLPKLKTLSFFGIYARNTHSITPASSKATPDALKTL
jgi:hypothetical protein